MAASVAIVSIYLFGCSSSASQWTAQDSTDLVDDVHTRAALMLQCESDAGCTAGQVSTVENDGICNLAAMLHHHGTDVLADGGAQFGCKPTTAASKP